MTMKELAKIANVSPATVSKVFREADDVSYETKQYIYHLAKEYGCFGKFYKGKYHKKIVAIIYPELVSNYYTSYVERLEKILANNNCIAVISVCHYDGAKQEELIEYYASYLRVDGIIVLGLKSKLKKGYETPIVAMFSEADKSIDTVDVDYRTALGEAIDCLTGYGHQNIAFLGETLNLKRAGLFRNAIKKFDIDDPLVYMSQYRFEEAGADGVRYLLDNHSDCTAVICAYDTIAYGAIKEIQRSGLRVPDDISVIGIDNIHMSQFLETSLTSIGPNADEVCMIAWELLSKKMQNKHLYSNQYIVIKGRLFVRDSVAEIKRK